MIISLIVATYNRPDALHLVLQSLETQTDKNFEVIIADDGSKDDTRSLINEFKSKSSLSIIHAWHEDLGFRLAGVRNLATKQSRGEYLIFLDGDCIVQPDFIAMHRMLAESNHMVTGGRVLLDKKLTNYLLKIGKWNFESFKKNLLIYRLNGQINKVLAFYIKFGNFSWRNYPNFVWRRIKGCNLACWKSDAIAIGGFDETITGWGHEDADFVFRLFDNGITRKSGSWATEVLHLYHPMSNKENAEENEQKVRARILAKSKKNTL
ncbi:glycosyltransferase family 2 protein [Polynucleobacter sphagniphilus]|uniref:glycosyltransferase family 2 protein n=1 Tax=Polynucleobacter sphagniphilus TaxID=1743169 RepID=UPI002405A112|nr:glycosyltransferase family 2 protein [Polynucleobacter sphagniphilus]MDF9789242.1 glycosyltransferase involved in cell wall biosynthesis [Polynucleobacter sphagniphilus]